MNTYADIITIGDEILIGQTIDSNSAFIGSKLSSMGFDVRQISSISDQGDEIKRALDEALERSSLVIITGGLGPTKDDITKNTLADYFGGRLVNNEQVMRDIENLLRHRNVPLNDLNIAQALVPDNCTVIPNSLGTAPGMCFEKEGRLVISLPGVPYEMKELMEVKVPALISAKFQPPVIVHRMVMTAGYPESFLASLIAGWEDSLPDNLHLAYLPSPGIVKLRITGKGQDREELDSIIDAEVDKLKLIIPRAIFSLENQSLEESTAALLKEKKLTISTAESCTGGNIARLLTSIPGSSEYFQGSVIAYSNRIKREILGVPQQVLNDFGAVSRQVVETMALNSRLLFNTDLSVAVSGIAGPDGGTPEKPVGTVWIALASRTGVKSDKFQFGNKRDLNITRASMAALNLIRISIT